MYPCADKSSESELLSIRARVTNARSLVQPWEHGWVPQQGL